MLGYLCEDITCSEYRTVFRERSSRKTVSYEEQIMSKDKYPNIFSLQIEAIVFIILQIFYATRAVLKIGEYPRIFPSFSWRIFAHETRLDQSRASENIWWIIMTDIWNFEEMLHVTCPSTWRDLSFISRDIYSNPIQVLPEDIFSPLKRLRNL